MVAVFLDLTWIDLVIILIVALKYLIKAGVLNLAGQPWTCKSRKRFLGWFIDFI